MQRGINPWQWWNQARSASTYFGLKRQKRLWKTKPQTSVRGGLHSWDVGPPFSYHSELVSVQHSIFVDVTQLPDLKRVETQLETHSAQQTLNHTESHWITLNHTESHWMNHTESHWITLNESHWITLNHTESHWITLNHTESHWITLNHTESHWITLNHTESHWITLNHTEPHWTTLNHTEPHWTTLNHTEPHWKCIVFRVWKMSRGGEKKKKNIKIKYIFWCLRETWRSNIMNG